jgi:hypothetical protein
MSIKRETPFLAVARRAARGSIREKTRPFGPPPKRIFLRQYFLSASIEILTSGAFFEASRKTMRSTRTYQAEDGRSVRGARATGRRPVPRWLARAIGPESLIFFRARPG